MAQFGRGATVRKGLTRYLDLAMWRTNTSLEARRLGGRPNYFKQFCLTAKSFKQNNFDF